MNTLTLKFIALITMTIDHFSFLLYQGHLITDTEYFIGRSIGRFAFPIYVYLLLIGFYKTHSRKRYCIRLFLFALLSELPYDYFRFQEWNTKEQNVFFTLLFAFLVFWYLEKIQTTFQNKALRILLSIAVISTFSFWAEILHFDYGFFGILLATVFYLAYQKKEDKTVQSMLLLFGICSILPIAMITNVFEGLIVLEIPLFIFLNEKKKIRLKKPMQYFFYFYYPAHLLLFGLLRK